MRDISLPQWGCLLAVFWTLGALPFWIGALLLLVVGATIEGRLFAIALLCLLPVPMVALYRCDAKRRWRLSTSILLVAGVTSLAICAVVSPNRTDSTNASARLLYLNGTSHSRYSPANLVPEVDQHILGSYLFGFVDLGFEQSSRVRRLFKDVYRDFDKDPELATLPSTMGFAYQDLFLGRREIGNVFVYIPPADDPVPAIVFLHGSLGNFQGYWQIWKSFAEKHGFAIVAPTYGAGNWYQAQGLEAIEHAYEYCATNPRLDDQRLILAGLSNGGTGVTRAAASAPDRWQAIVLLSPVLEQGVIDTKEFGRGWKDRPLLLISGEADRRTQARSLRAAESIMLKAGVDVQSHYVPAEDHFLAFSKWAKIEQWMAEWMLTHQLLP